MSDPFTLIHENIWTMLEASSAFTSLVPEGNRIRLAGLNRATKLRTSTAGRPEVRVVPNKLYAHVARTSNGSSIRRNWQIQISTGDLRVGEQLFPLEWAIFRALSDPASMEALDLGSVGSKVLRARLTDQESSAQHEELNRGINGWVTLWLYIVEVWFETANLPP